MLRHAPPQIVRLVLVTVAILTAYLVARVLLTPPSFGQYGWYRGDAITESASLTPVYSGKKACSECHAPQADLINDSGHKSLSCEVCHGAGEAHSLNPDQKPAILHFSHCVRCHETSPSKPSWMKQVVSKEHYSGDSCTECHPPHQPVEKQ